jgi:Fe-S cluster biosynthesis and repair protein YggX
MSNVACHRCGQSRPGLDESPLPGAWGTAVQAETCIECWRAWSEEQTRLINHFNLKPFRAGDKRIIYRQLHAFLNLRGVEVPPPEPGEVL